MENEQIPAWAIELIKQVERLNEKIPNHIDWVEGRIGDHERRIRFLEKTIWLAVGGAAILSSTITLWLNAS